MGKQSTETVSIKGNDVAVLDLGTKAVAEAPKASTEIIASEYRSLAKPIQQIQEIVKEAVSGSGMTVFSLDRIKVPSAESSVWSVPTLMGNKPQEFIDAVILHMVKSRSYWPDPIGVGPAVPPSCTSSDSIMGIGTPGGPCRKCPLAEFGTAVKGNGKPAKGQACRQGRMMFILRPQDVIPLLLTIPPGSLKETDKFFMRFTQQDLSPKLVVMRFALKQTQNSEGTKYNQVEITMLRPLNTEEMARMIDIQELWKPYFGQTTLEAEDLAGDAGE